MWSRCTKAAAPLFFLLAYHPYPVPDGLPVVTGQRFLRIGTLAPETSSPEVMACFPYAVSDTDAHFVFKVQYGR